MSKQSKDLSLIHSQIGAINSRLISELLHQSSNFKALTQTLLPLQSICNRLKVSRIGHKIHLIIFIKRLHVVSDNSSIFFTLAAEVPRLRHTIVGRKNLIKVDTKYDIKDCIKSQEKHTCRE